jgi:ABC-2 type transport system permease protein
MPQTDTSKPSFSGGRRWLGAMNTILAAAAVLALAVMLNYLAGGHFHRFQLSRDAAFKLSRQTKAVLASLTNDVQVTIFFQPDGDNVEIYGLTSALLAEYQNANPRHLHVRLLDYTRYAGPAKELLAKLDLSGPREKDFVLFESSGHHKIVYAREMAEYDYSDLLARRSKYVRRNAFRGELLFTSYIYDVSNPQALKTYFLHGHGENDPGNPSGEPENLGDYGYSKLAAILKEECDSDWDRLSLMGTNDVPRDCQLLIVAGPRQGEFFPGEVDKIAAYLKNGGRLLALLTKPCGLDSMLAKQWGVRLGAGRVVDKDPHFNVTPYTFRTAKLSSHLIVDALINDETPIVMVWPRPVYPVEDRGKIPGAPDVTILASTSPGGMDENNHADTYPLLAAVEQGVIKGVDTPRGGGTKIVVAGDSDFLDDQVIAYSGNHVFAKLALSWLLQRPAVMIEGLGPQPIKEYSLHLTTAQGFAVRWLFLGAMPAAILALGALVWLRRRR